MTNESNILRNRMMSYLPSFRQGALSQGFIGQQMDAFRLRMSSNDNKNKEEDSAPSNVPKGFEKFIKKGQQGSKIKRENNKEEEKPEDKK